MDLSRQHNIGLLKLLHDNPDRWMKSYEHTCMCKQKYLNGLENKGVESSNGETVRQSASCNLYYQILSVVVTRR